MKFLAAFYFSGTGNTRYVTEKISENLKNEYRVKIIPVTSRGDFGEILSQADLVLLSYPVYGSAPPVPMREFVHKYKSRFKGKKTAIAVTQYFFSGDGAASLGRTIEKFGGKIIAAEHFNMPNNLSDCKIFPVKNGEDIKRTVNRADKKAKRFAENVMNGKISLKGFGIASHALGFFGQRVFWMKNEKAKRKALKIGDSCVGCGLCAKECPVNNIEIADGKALPLGNCALCYRCVNLCPKRAITLIGSSSPAIRYEGIKR